VVGLVHSLRLAKIQAITTVLVWIVPVLLKLSEVITQALAVFPLAELRGGWAAIEAIGYIRAAGWKQLPCWYYLCEVVL
jgi:hypothetical protein